MTARCLLPLTTITRFNLLLKEFEKGYKIMHWNNRCKSVSDTFGLRVAIAFRIVICASCGCCVSAKTSNNRNL